MEYKLGDATVPNVIAIPPVVFPCVVISKDAVPVDAAVFAYNNNALLLQNISVTRLELTVSNVKVSFGKARVNGFALDDIPLWNYVNNKLFMMLGDVNPRLCVPST